MATRKQLSLEQRELLALVSQAASTNPFSEEFLRLQQKIAGCDESVPLTEQIKLTIQRWDDELHKLHTAGMTNLKHVQGEDRELLRNAFLYKIFHRFLAAFDQLISDQIAAGERSVPVKFVGKVDRKSVV